MLVLMLVLDARAEAPILWPPDVKSQLIGKDPDSRKDRGQEEKGAIEYGMVGWRHRLSGHEFEQRQGDSEGQGSLVCCSSWDQNESDTTEQLSTNNIGSQRIDFAISPPGLKFQLLFLRLCSLKQVTLSLSASISSSIK